MCSLYGMALANTAEMRVKHSFDSEHYQLQSAVCGKFVIPLAKKVTLGCRSFKYTGPSLWNALPHDIQDSCLTLIHLEMELKLYDIIKHTIFGCFVEIKS